MIGGTIVFAAVAIHLIVGESQTFTEPARPQKLEA
jgi:hypothetical protein